MIIPKSTPTEAQNGDQSSDTCHHPLYSLDSIMAEIARLIESQRKKTVSQSPKKIQPHFFPNRQQLPPTNEAAPALWLTIAEVLIQM